MRGDNQQQDRFYELLKPELPRLQAFCQKLLGDPDQGDDLVQDSLYSAWKNFGGLRDEAVFRPWLYRIVINRYRTNLRQFKKRIDVTVSLADDIVDQKSLDLRAVRERVRIAMTCLSATDRALVTLHELEGWSYSELTEMFYCKEGALRTRLTRCRDKMREKLRQYLEETDENALMTGVSKECVVVKQEKS